MNTPLVVATRAANDALASPTASMDAFALSVAGLDPGELRTLFAHKLLDVMKEQDIRVTNELMVRAYSHAHDVPHEKLVGLTIAFHTLAEQLKSLKTSSERRIHRGVVNRLLKAVGRRVRGRD